MTKTDFNMIVWYSENDILKQKKYRKEGFICLTKYTSMALQERIIGYSWPTKAENTDQLHSINWKYE